MAAPKTTIWTAEPQTLAKHTVLRRYLQAWFPILGSAHNRIVYLDGFAGPGRYTGGEAGSPVIALEAARDHQSRMPALSPVFLFVEQDPARAEHLRDVEIPALGLPKTFQTEVVNAEFAETLRSTLDEIDQAGLQLAPTFALVDPFGITGLPFALVKRLLARKRCEVMITFMSYAIQRFVDELPNQVNELIGREDAAELIRPASDRVEAAGRLYAEALRTAAKYVSFFRMESTQGTVIYDLFFATNSERGFEKMKEAMWLADPTGGTRFRAGADPSQMNLLESDDNTAFVAELQRRFHGRTVSWEEVEKFAVEHAIFLPKHARAALRGMESGAHGEKFKVLVSSKKADGSRRRAGTFPAGTEISFSKGATS